ncbi:hypothetical protein AB0D90_23500 [Streptomyces althioticus]|uniref:hypothetical protein n=1 Tax=Streptomyces althioticus TaxID=83380 RepID=UPI0033E2749F
MAAIDWGSVPTWFSAIGTTGSLIATLTIVLRDRRKDEREDAACLAIWVDPDEKFDSWRPVLRLHNAAGRPVFDVILHCVWFDRDVETGERWTEMRREPLAAVVRAGAELKLPGSYYMDHVTFRDAHQVAWRYDLENKILTREPDRLLIRTCRSTQSWVRRQRTRVVRAWRRRRSDGGEAAPEEAS